VTREGPEVERSGFQSIVNEKQFLSAEDVSEIITKP